MTKKIYLDLETIGTNKFHNDIIELCTLFVENKTILDTLNTKVTITKQFSELTNEEIKDLQFHNIYNQEDINSHNEHAYPIQKVLELLLTKVKLFGKVAISGWNNSGFDNLILERHLISLGININDYFNYHTRDIMHKIETFEELGYIGGLSLKYCHNELVGGIREECFHTAYTDCIAVKDLDEWVEDIMEVLRR